MENESTSVFDVVIWSGACLSLLGLVGLVWCIVRVSKAKRANRCSKCKENLVFAPKTLGAKTMHAYL